MTIDARRPPFARAMVAFALILALYQTSEGLQTIFAPSSAIGPALMLAAVLVAWPLGRWLGWRGYDAYGLDLERRSLALVACGMLLASLAFLASRALGGASGIYGPPAAARSASIAITVAMALVTTFVPSIAEDILTRGFLLRTFPVRLTGAAYIVGTAVLYTVNHIWRFDWGVSEQVRLLCLGLAYGAAAWRWRNLWAAVGLHWGWNFTNVLADHLMPVETLQIDAARYLSALVNLAMFAIVLLIPKGEGAADPGSTLIQGRTA